jgi:uncharacterized protein
MTNEDMSLQLITVHRTAQPDTLGLEGTDGRTLTARLLRWNTVNEVSDDGVRVYRESWLKGSFARTIQTAKQKGARFPLFAVHPLLAPGVLPVGAASQIVERDDGPWMEAKISKTQAGDEMIELIRDGAIPGVSVGARILKSRVVDGIVQRVEAALNEITLTAFPALEGADIMALRSALLHSATRLDHKIESEPDSDEETDDPSEPHPELLETREFLANLQRP